MNVEIKPILVDFPFCGEWAAAHTSAEKIPSRGTDQLGQRLTYDFLRIEGRRGKKMDKFMKAAVEEAQKGLAEGGIPIGSVLVIAGEIVGRGHNRRVQKGSTILHAEMDCLENAGRLKAAQYRQVVLYSTLSPCDMCSGAVLLYKIPKVMVGENQTFCGPEEYLRSRGVEVEVLNEPGCIRMMSEFIAAHPLLWNEDIGE